MNNCHGNTHGCCDGYFRDRNVGACVKCPKGYTATNCSEKCRYPSYGVECQLECQCNETECHYSTGCMNISTENLRMLYHYYAATTFLRNN
ncbi:multiple epidermal growth factor-like domains protein 10 [Saccostrea cucullata]|uniref:multiple epidermal growth factor-like domains protein 10 n=1 Tax=Saccostrea cuccullata TaxID=36930 RepID=UPI002ED62CD1